MTNYLASWNNTSSLYSCKSRRTSKSNEKVPKVEIVFLNEGEAYKFYNEYAKMIGFHVCKDKNKKLADGMIRKSFVCSKHFD